MNWKQVPDSDVENLKQLIQEMENMGYTLPQWGLHGIVLGLEVEVVPAFFEAFGKAFIRGEGESVLAAATEAMGIMKKQDACSHPDGGWKYTHNNGHKTCGWCGYFAPCTPDEAFKNYTNGEVKVPELDTHVCFDFRRPLCAKCGGHALVSERDFDVYLCTSCHQLHEIVRDDSGFPEYGEMGYTYCSIDERPKVVGFWHIESQKWLGYNGRARTYRFSDIERYKHSISHELAQPGLELRVINLDLTPGDIVSFAYDKETEDKKFSESLKSIFDHLAKPESNPE
jgi:hypothetical protein